MRFGGIPLPLLSRSARNKLKRKLLVRGTTSFPPSKRNGARECARRMKQLARAAAKDKR